MIISKVADLRQELNSKDPGAKVGLVPTMGYLHRGHLSLIERARAENDIVVLSIFVNPTQFTPNEDFDSYPRDLEKDCKLAYQSGANYIFAPSDKEMYGANYSTYVNVDGNISRGLCGKSRPNHFRGVTTIVSKLFNIVNPSNAYFGMKDAQQLSIINRMVKDLNYNINIVPCPIVRDENGLALSSRNAYLTDEAKKQALILSRSLKEAKTLYLEGENNAQELKRYIRGKINSMSLAKIDYVEIVDQETLENIDYINRPSIIALAVYFGKSRLLDNIVLGG